MSPLVAGSGEEPLDVCGARGGRGTEGTHRRVDGAHQSAGGREHVPAGARQPGHARAASRRREDRAAAGTAAARLVDVCVRRPPYGCAMFITRLNVRRRPPRVPMDVLFSYSIKVSLCVASASSAPSTRKGPLFLV